MVRVVAHISQDVRSLRSKPCSHSRKRVNQKSAPGVIRPDLSVEWRVGDKAKHGKWGIGTVVSVKGKGEEVELKIAFPDQGVKGLMQKYAPIEKV